MTERDERAIERDWMCAVGLGHGALQMRRCLEEWLQQELIDLKYKTQVLEPVLKGPVLGGLQEVMARLDEIDYTELPMVSKMVQTRIDEIWNDKQSEPFDARIYLDEGIARLEKIARVVNQLRGQIDNLMQNGYEPSDEDDDEVTDQASDE